MTDEPKAFSGPMAYGSFSGVKNYLEYLGFKDFIKLPKVVASPLFSMVGYSKMDLGIVKYHFETGAGKENFEWL